MTPISIPEGVRKLAPWFHQIDLPGGLQTKTESYFGEDADHPKPTWAKVRQAFPDSFAGKRVLDVGCNAGFYSFEALERGAEYVLGVDAVRWQVQQARFVAQAKGVANADFQRASIYELDPRKHGTFDVVLALGLVYHLKHLIAGLERLFTVTDDLLIVESAVISPDDFACGKSEPVQRASDELYLVGFSKNSPSIQESAFNWFFPTADALRAMIEGVGFVDVEVVDVFFNRCLITARKPKHPIDGRYPAYLRADIVAPETSWSCAPGDTMRIPLRVANIGGALWRAPNDGEEKGSVRMAGRLYSEDDPVFGAEIPTRRIEKDLAPGDSWSVTAEFKAPAKAGAYTLEIDLVSEHVSLFQDAGSVPLELALLVK